MNEKSQYSVLMADDSEDDRFFLRRALSEFPYLNICAEVGDGQEALSYVLGEGQFADRIKYPVPDLLLLDIKMPRKDGFEVLETLRSKKLKVPIIVISGGGLDVDQKRCVDLGASGFLPKSKAQGDKDILVALINVCLGRPITSTL